MFSNKHNKNKLGFTLVELLIVIAIIGILATAAVVNLRTLKSKARDVRRLSDITQIRKALEVYNYGEGAYPGAHCTGLVGLVDCLSWASNNDWIPGLDPMPKDPLNMTGDDGVYYRYLYQIIADNPKNHYLLYYNLETEPRKDECNVVGDYSGSFSCVSVGVTN
jgi:prepilin-type N-terminal cleavage/methylation domain-containing protein